MAVRLGGYGNTNEGKIIAAAFMDNYNNIVGSSAMTRAAAQRRFAEGGSRQGGVAGRTFAEGDVLTPKIGNVPLRADASDTAKPLATLQRGEEVIVTGVEKDGYVKVQGVAAEGWVKMVLMTKR